MYNVARRFHLSISSVEGIQTLKEAYPKNGQQRKKYPRLAKHPSNAYLHGSDILVAIEHSNEFHPYKWGNEAQDLETVEAELVLFLSRRRQTGESQSQGCKKQRICDNGYEMPKPEGPPRRKAKDFVDLCPM